MDWLKFKVLRIFFTNIFILRSYKFLIYIFKFNYHQDYIYI